MPVDEKKLKKVIKEGGKRGVEIEGAATMGGLEFFCTKVDEPEGDVDLLIQSVEAMNAEVDENEEERKGGSGDIGKMIFSTSDERVAIVAYVPESKKDKIDAKAWLEAVVSQYEGKVLSGDNKLASGEIRANPDKGIFTLKVRDEALTKGVEYLRSKGCFPEASNDDSDDDVVFGDDFDFDNAE
ncbi:uncharacterized protein SPPG_00136 [Spizellomyces punctatus DAOM BR117]|uniref:Uncharacterized protein n=1 Tax=Spizellomyces punctatus (strain DAOM BR117) TaxID=645134 RepID=A0A0L0HSR7_SPIPD|nr:uncharacterized protein SPPG_00136 [Spizellomyces punctatus DAOM BR117]KND04406.1 hypothetical protein SPPG_00136 [Spizellomyces punctatus DAOM BR117]|eukprot:XP_016612445.1 hypothetical protein SPPG_00136 [Spizellomyces punctatus DAOM BR117]